MAAPFKGEAPIWAEKARPTGAGDGPVWIAKVRTVLLLAPTIQSQVVESKERGQSASGQQSISSDRFTMGIAASLKLPLAGGERFRLFAHCCSSESRVGSTSRGARL